MPKTWLVVQHAIHLYVRWREAPDTPKCMPTPLGTPKGTRQTLSSRTGSSRFPYGAPLPKRRPVAERKCLFEWYESKREGEEREIAYKGVDAPSSVRVREL